VKSLIANRTKINV